MPDTENYSNGRGLALVPPHETDSDAAAPPPAEAAPSKKRPGRPPGTKNGEGKKAKAAADKRPKKVAAKKPAPKTQAKKKELVRVRSSELKARAASGDGDAVKLIKTIQRAHQKWSQALARKAQVSTECGQRVKSAEAAFTNSVEASLEVGKVETAALLHWRDAVTTRWQEWGEAKAQNIEEKKGARDDVKAALEGLNEAIEESRQQRLPGLG